MADPIAKTFQALTSTSNPHAVELLVAALDVPLPPIQIRAVRSLVGRGSVREQLETIRRYQRFSETVRGELEGSASALLPAIRQCLMLGRKEWETPALELARSGEAYGVVEILLEVLQGDRTELHEEAVQTIRHLVNRLYDHLHGHQSADAPRPKNAAQIQQITLSALEKSLASFGTLTCAETVVESILALGGPGHEIAQNLFNKASQECKTLAKDLLMTSRHPGVMRFVLESLSRTYPPARVFDAVQNRDDPEFVLATLRWVPKRFTNTQERNLRQIERIGWLSQGGEPLSMIPEDLQFALMTFVSATGIIREEKSELRQWVVRHGTPDARTAALEVLKEMGADVVQEIVLDGLDSEDPDVQAWATGQLRSQHVPEAVQKLIDQLDNPAASVQEVARQELDGFDLECLLSRFESLSPTARENAGRLLEKVDPQFLEKLAKELHHSIRRRRLRAIRGAQAYGWHLRLAEELRSMLGEEDTLIRRAAVEVLADIPSAETLAALTAMQNDPSPRVRETVEKALANISPGKNSSLPQS